MTTPTIAALLNIATLGAHDRNAEQRRSRSARLRSQAQAQAATELEQFRTPTDVRFAVALTAAFRERQALELSAAARDGRPAPTLQVFTLPGRAVWWRDSLERDFRVTTPEQAEELASCLSQLALEDAAAAVTDQQRAVATYQLADTLHLLGLAAGTGLMARLRAAELAAPLARATARLHDSWADWAQDLLAGHLLCTRDATRQVSLTASVRRLLADARSPWRQLSWPR